MRGSGWRWIGLALVLGSGACGGTSGSPPDGGPDMADLGPEMSPGCGPFDPNVPCQGPPGLYAPGSCTELADGIRYFEPTYVLWSDGASKERFIYLPPDTEIDVTDPDEWVFPVGTRFYKTFSLGGTRIETRVLIKVGDEAGNMDGKGQDAWTYQAYVWNCEQTLATYLGDMHAGVTDALGTTHDIPSHGDCITCHAQYTQDIGLSFSAIQLNHEPRDDLPIPYPQLTLATLNDGDFLTAMGSTTTISVDAAVIPGRVGSAGEQDREALGYLHANCGNCHRGPVAPGGLPGPFRMWVLVGTPDVQSTSTLTTGLGVGQWCRPGTACGASDVLMRLSAGQPLVSAVFYRMSRRNAIEMLPGVQMPPIGTNIPNPEGTELLRAWITSLATLGP